MHIKEFCTEHEIESIIWIDDDHATQAIIQLDKLVTELGNQCIDSDENLKKSVKGLFIKTFDDSFIRKISKAFKCLDGDDSSAFEEQITILLNELDDPRKLILTALDSIHGSLPTPEAIKSVNDYLLLGKTTKKLSFTEWRKQSNQLLSSLKTQKHLILLDIQNTKEAGIDFGPEGKNILEELSSNEIADEVIVIVLTSTIDIDNELSYGCELSKDYLCNSSLPIFALSKANRFDKNASKALEEVFNRIVLIGSYSMLKNKLSEKYKESIETVFSELKPITIEELVFCVARNSDIDGVSELDALMRVIDHEAKRSFKRSILDDLKLKELIFRCRKFDSEIEIRNDIDKDGIISFHLSESYDDIEVINALHTQLLVGDIFEIGSAHNKHLYLLVGNVCNTSLRGNTGKRKDKSALLFPLDCNTPSENSIIVGSSSQFPKYFNNVEDIAIDITRPYTINFKYLDLCWTQEDGVAKVLNTIYVKYLINRGVLSRAQKNRISIMMEKPIRPVDMLNNIARVGRISEGRALEIMQEYTRRLSLIPRDVSFLV